MQKITILTSSALKTEALGARLGARLRGGEVLELAGDVGSGKTTFVRGLARGIKSPDAVASPTFVLSKTYRGQAGLSLHHCDFYRLEEAGVMRAALAEAAADERAVVVVEWGQIVADVLPQARLMVRFEVSDEEARRLHFSAPDQRHRRLLRGLA